MTEINGPLCCLLGMNGDSGLTRKSMYPSFSYRLLILYLVGRRTVFPACVFVPPLLYCTLGLHHFCSLLLFTFLPHFSCVVPLRSIPGAVWCLAHSGLTLLKTR